MEKISNTIYDSYVNAFQELDGKFQLHFASRLSQWDGDPTAAKLLEQVVDATKPAATDIPSILTNLLRLQSADDPSINEQSLRAEYFQKYPELYGLHQALFQIRNWLYHYGIDARETLRSLPDFPGDHALVGGLLADSDALAVLSTYAVNTIYLTRRLLDGDESTIFSPEDIERIIPTDDSPNLLLLTYFVTHCVIAETLFYARPISAERLPEYRQMLDDLEARLDDRIDELTVDAKLEFLVATSLCGGHSTLQDKILSEAAAQFDEAKGYITDAKRPNKNDLNGAEHRNVLFLLATRPCKLLA